MVRKNLDEGATPLLIIHLLIQYLLLLQTMIPNSQLIFLPSAKRGLRKNQPDLTTGVDAMIIFVHFRPIFAHFRNFDEFCCYSHLNRWIVRQKLKLPVCTAIAPKFRKIAFGVKISPENSFSATFSATFSIFREIRADSSIALLARVVCKISGISGFICQKFVFGQQIQRQCRILPENSSIKRFI